MQVDLTPLIQAAANAGVPIVAAFAVPLLVRLARRAGISLTEEQQQQIEAAIVRAAEVGAQGAEHLAAAKGWDHPDVRDEFVAKGLQYLLDHEAPAIGRAADIVPGSVTLYLQQRLVAAAPAALAKIAVLPTTTDGPVKAA